MTVNLEIYNSPKIGLEIYQLISKLYPICRSITGDGVRKTLNILQEFIPLELHEVPSGTPVFDWIVPQEWNINDAYVLDPQGEKVIDFQQSNLHVLNYSTPIDRKMPLSELKEHLFSLPDRPDWIPYRTSYYQENWGFCLSHHALENLADGEYEVYINSSLAPGSLTYGEYYVPGETSDEILFSCHTCHPSLCNDNLSGIGLATFLAKQLEAKPHRYSYRFVFLPGTIGSITWLSINHYKVDCIKHGLVVAGVGDSGKLTYKKSRRGDAEIDRAVAHILKHSGQEYAIEDFSPYGYDERQYCSPGFNLPVGSLTRTPFNRYPEYHTSADNLDFIQPTALADSLAKYLAVIDILENNKTYLNTNPHCEPQLGKRGLYGNFGGKKSTKTREMAMLWVLNLADGSYSLLEIADRANLPFSTIHEAAIDLVTSGLLSEIQPILIK
jgi:aminopeptidase-like protein